MPFFYHTANFRAGFFPVLGSVLKPGRDCGAPGCPVTGRGNACYYLLSSEPESSAGARWVGSGKEDANERREVCGID